MILHHKQLYYNTFIVVGTCIIGLMTFKYSSYVVTLLSQSISQLLCHIKLQITFLNNCFAFCLPNGPATLTGHRGLKGCATKTMALTHNGRLYLWATSTGFSGKPHGSAKMRCFTLRNAIHPHICNYEGQNIYKDENAGFRLILFQLQISLSTGWVETMITYNELEIMMWPWPILRYQYHPRRDWGKS